MRHQLSIEEVLHMVASLLCIKKISNNPLIDFEYQDVSPDMKYYFVDLLNQQLSFIASNFEEIVKEKGGIHFEYSFEDNEMNSEKCVNGGYNGNLANAISMLPILEEEESYWFSCDFYVSLVFQKTRNGQIGLRIKSAKFAIDTIQ